MQDSILADMLKSRYNKVPCLVSAQESIPLSFEDEDLVVDKVRYAILLNFYFSKLRL